MERQINFVIISFLLLGLAQGATTSILISNYSSTSTNDTYFNNQWAIQKSKLDLAWDIYTGSSSTKVGVIDSGIEATHEDLSSNINTTLSSYFGPYNLNPLNDYIDHGTFVSGIIGAKGNNGIGVSGACWDVNLISLSVANYASSSVSIPGISDAISYASSSSVGIPILNASIGASFSSISNFGYDIFEILSDFDDAMDNYDGLLICVAGNGENFNAYNHNGRSIENLSNYIFPACETQPNMIVVGNSDNNDERTSNSNYGATKVDLFAPGAQIATTSNNNSYVNVSGTSFAAPLVTGTAALLKSIDPTLTALQIKNAILNNVDEKDALEGLCSTGGRLNAYAAALSILPEITTSDTYSYTSSPDYQKFMKINCSSGHYSLSLNSSVPYKVTVYKKYHDNPLAQLTAFNGGANTIQFLSSSAQTVFVRIENLGNVSSNMDVNLSYQNHSYTNSYVFSDLNYHKAYCTCGEYVLLPHLVMIPFPGSNTGTCALCNATIPINSNGAIMLESENESHHSNHFEILNTSIIQCY